MKKFEQISFVISATLCMAFSLQGIAYTKIRKNNISYIYIKYQ